MYDPDKDTFFDRDTNSFYFTLADILWAYLWTWAGGVVPGVDEKLNSRGEVIVEAAN